MTIRRMIRAILLVSSLSVMAACDSAEERAEVHFQNAQTLLAEGDTDRALVELRNVFKLNGRHHEARSIYAEIVRERGDLREAYGQYLRLIEQYPDDTKARLALAQMAVQSQNWDDVERHTKRLIEITPDDPDAKIVLNALDYREAVQDKDASKRREELEAAIALKAERPNDQIVRNVIIDGYLRDGEDALALGEVEEALELAPKERRLYQMQLQLLNKMGDQDAVEKLLQSMVKTFPDDQVVKSTLIRFYMSRNDLKSAEEFLRAQVIPNEKDDAARTTLVQFLSRTTDYETTRSELDRLIAEGTNNDRFRAYRAALDFDNGKRDQALTELEDIVANAEPSDQTREIKISLARYFIANGNEVGARALVEEVLQEDPSMVDALKIQAGWLIESDQADQAISVLRTALDQAPNDPDVRRIMAAAHLRNGNRELAGEMLSLAAEASNNAPRESLQYARFLMSDGKYLPAESVLITALRSSPGNIDILNDMGRVYLELKDWGRAEQVERDLRAINSDEANLAADRIHLALLRGQDRGDDMIKFLEAISQDEGSEVAAKIAIIRAEVARGDLPAARNYLEQLRAADPGLEVLEFLDGAMLSAEGKFAEAEVAYEALLKKNPKAERIWMELIRLQGITERPEEASKTLQRALAEIPDGRDLQWARATELERAGDLDGAIEIYESLYDQNTSTAIVANNLASLLSVTRSDPESLSRAYAVARRLRGSDFPPFQDTYGWIAYLRGDYADALLHLEPAAKALNTDPMVQYHYGMTLSAMERAQDAIKQLKLALELAGDDPRPEFETARNELAKLEKLPQ